MTLPIAPMLADPGELPVGEDWVHEFKWDGVRAVVAWDGVVRAWSRNGNDFTPSFPELSSLEGLLPDDSVLDAEIVAVDERGRPDFGRLQHRLHRAVEAASAIVEEIPVVVFAFDLLRLQGNDLVGLPWSDRRRLLEALELDAPALKVPPVFDAVGSETLDAARALGLEGVVAKRRTAVYEPGRRSTAWRKVKLFDEEDFVVAGWTEGSGRLTAAVGSLLLGTHDSDGTLRFVGSVGSGLSDADRDRLVDHFEQHAIDHDPFGIGAQRPEAHFVEPTMVIRVRYSQWTRDLVLRHPSYIGVRIHRRPDEVRTPTDLA